MLAWLTEDAIPSARKSLAIDLPDNEKWRAAFLGAFFLLTQEKNWESFGTLTPQQMADEWLDVFLQFEEQSKLMIPIGVISPFGGAVAPDGWLLCDGLAVSRVTYADLFAVIGTKFGGGNGTTTFNLPDCAGMVLIGMPPAVGGVTTIGDVVGEKEHALTVTELPAHSHAAASGFGSFIEVRNGGTGGTAGLAAGVTMGAAQIANTGGGGTHNNMQPSLTTNFIIKY